MNQILQTNSHQNTKKSTIQNISSSSTDKLHYFFKIQLYFSIVIFIFLTVYVGFAKHKLSQEENFSKTILENYNMTKLYSNQSDYTSNKTTENIDITNNIGSTLVPYDNIISSPKNSYTNDSSIIGIINISNLHIYYPIFSTCSEELLKISPCRFSGPMPGKSGNLCIAGHNYDNGKFFSNVSLLKINDEIILSDYTERQFYYFVSDIYEVKNDDLNPIYDFDKNLKCLTLITCNNVNKNRIIVRAIMK